MRRLAVRATLVGVVVAASFTFGRSPAGALPAPPTVEAWIYPGGTGEPTCQTAAELAALASSPVSLLKPEYLTVSGRGQVRTETAAALPCNGFSAANLALVRAAAGRVEVTVSAGRSGVRGLLASPAREAAARDAIVGFVTGNGLDGADLDFEPGRWTARLWQRFVGFVSGLSAALSPGGMGVEVDLGPFTATPWDAERYADVPAAGAHLVVMAYDHEYDVACAPVAPFSWLAAVTTYARSQVAQADLTIGIPAYGYTTSTCRRVAHVRSNVAYVTMAQAPGFPATAAAASAARDATSGELRWLSGGTFYDVVDATALNAKLAVVETAGATDVSVWSLGGEPWFTGDPG